VKQRSQHALVRRQAYQIPITFFLLFAVFLTGTNCSLREKSIATSWLMSFRSIHGGWSIPLF